jgi:hypothetical protein
LRGDDGSANDEQLTPHTGEWPAEYSGPDDVTAQHSDPFPGGVFLFNPDADYDARGVDNREFAQYINQLAAASTDVLSRVSPSAFLDVVVVIRTGRRSRVWFVGDHPALNLLDLKNALESVVAPHITSGSIGFALLWRKSGPRTFTLPEEWKAIAVAEQRSISIDEMIDRVWPDEKRRWLTRWF